MPSRRSGLAIKTALICLSGLLAGTCWPSGDNGLEVFPKHFLLHPGEQIHYTVLEWSEGNHLRFADAQFSVEDPVIIRLIKPSGIFEAVRRGRAQILVRTSTSETRITIEVSGRARPPLMAVPYSVIREFVARDLLFVGHANLDGFDHTAVAKVGIDHLVQESKKRGRTIVYWISKEYPDWYTADRHPDYAVISEGQEHQVRVDAERVIFAGGSFMFCLLRNAQMTLHAMVKENRARHVNFIFPAEAIWVEDIWGPGEKRPYPASMILLKTLFGRYGGDAQAYDELVVPFLDRLIQEFPVAGYPAEAPAPPLRALVKDWNIVIRFGGRFERVYQSGDSKRTLVIEFQSV